MFAVYVYGPYDYSIVGPFDTRKAAGEWARRYIEADSPLTAEVAPIVNPNDWDESATTAKAFNA